MRTAECGQLLSRLLYGDFPRASDMLGTVLQFRRILGDGTYSELDDGGPDQLYRNTELKKYLQR